MLYWLKALKNFRAGGTLVFLLILFVVFVVQSQFAGARFTLTFSTIPILVVQTIRALQEGLAVDLTPLRSLVTAIFLHGDIQHLASNMLFLWIFGALIEETLGKFWLGFIILVAGAFGNLAQAYLHPQSFGSVLGASGALCGLEGTYLALALSWKLPWPHIWPIARPIAPIQLAMLAVIGAVIDILSLTGGERGIAYGAHLGGVFAGISIGLAIAAFRGPRRPSPNGLS